LSGGRVEGEQLAAVPGRADDGVQRLAVGAKLQVGAEVTGVFAVKDEPALLAIHLRDVGEPRTIPADDRIERAFRAAAARQVNARHLLAVHPQLVAAEDGFGEHQMLAVLARELQPQIHRAARAGNGDAAHDAFGR
jgi:hypothetical protein